MIGPGDYYDVHKSNGKDGRRNGPPDVADPPEEEVRESSC